MLSQTERTRRSRLEASEKKSNIDPFFRANTLDSLNLYWLGVSAWPPAPRDREWIASFMGVFFHLASEKLKVEAMQFLQMSPLSGSIRDLFLKVAHETRPMMGVSCRPNHPPKLPPSEEELEKAIEQKTPDTGDAYSKDYAYWFLKGDLEAQRQYFLTHGGMTMLLIEPDKDAKITVPEFPKFVMEHPSMRHLTSKIDLQSEVRVLEMLRSKFREESLKAFGEPFQDLSHFRGIPFVLPLWSSSDFLNASEAQLAPLFSLMKIYVRESPEDRGILIASRDNLDEVLEESVNSLREKKLYYSGMQVNR